MCGLRKPKDGCTLRAMEIAENAVDAPRVPTGDEPGPLHQYVLRQLEKSKYRWPAVAEGSGVPVRTIEKVASRATKFPRIDTIEKLAGYFQAQEQEAGQDEGG